MIEIEAEDLRNGFCRRHLKITNTKVKQINEQRPSPPLKKIEMEPTVGASVRQDNLPSACVST